MDFRTLDKFMIALILFFVMENMYRFTLDSPIGHTILKVDVDMPERHFKAGDLVFTEKWNDGSFKTLEDQILIFGFPNLPPHVGFLQHKCDCFGEKTDCFFSFNENRQFCGLPPFKVYSKINPEISIPKFGDILSLIFTIYLGRFAYFLYGLITYWIWGTDTLVIPPGLQ